MSGENDELPNGWAKTALEEIARDVTYGYTAKSNRTSGVPKILRITDKPPEKFCLAQTRNTDL